MHHAHTCTQTHARTHDSNCYPVRHAHTCTHTHTHTRTHTRTHTHMPEKKSNCCPRRFIFAIFFAAGTHTSSPHANNSITCITHTHAHTHTRARTHMPATQNGEWHAHTVHTCVHRYKQLHHMQHAQAHTHAHAGKIQIAAPCVSFLRFFFAAGTHMSSLHAHTHTKSRKRPIIHLRCTHCSFVLHDGGQVDFVCLCSVRRSRRSDRVQQEDVCHDRRGRHALRSQPPRHAGGPRSGWRSEAAVPVVGGSGRLRSQLRRRSHEPNPQGNAWVVRAARARAQRAHQPEPQAEPHGGGHVERQAGGWGVDVASQIRERETVDGRE